MTPLELKIKARELEERIKSLESQLVTMREVLDNVFLAMKIPDQVEKEVKQSIRSSRKCPKCGVKPGYFFHVRACKG